MVIEKTPVRRRRYREFWRSCGWSDRINVLFWASKRALTGL